MTERTKVGYFKVLRTRELSYLFNEFLVLINDVVELIGNLNHGSSIADNTTKIDVH